jgi:hypothetical protein
MLVALVLTTACTGSRTPSVFVPAQQLRLLDADNRLLAMLDLGFSDNRRTVSFIVYDARGGVAASSYHIDAPMLFLYGQVAGDTMWIRLGFPALTFSRPYDPKSPSARGRGDLPLGKAAFALALLRSLYDTSFPKVRPPLDEIVPTQDLRLLDKNNSPVATLGLTQSAEPAVVVTDQRGLPVVIWAADLQGGMTILGFDETGRQRVQADLGPGNDVALLISEKGDSDNPDHDDLFTLDPTTLQEVRGSLPRSIPWLARDIPPYRTPVSLVDQRDHVLWRSVEPAAKGAAAALRKPDTSSDTTSTKAVDLARTSRALHMSTMIDPRGLSIWAAAIRFSPTPNTQSGTSYVM